MSPPPLSRCAPPSSPPPLSSPLAGRAVRTLPTRAPAPPAP
eukprot:gene30685-61611_t